MHVDLIILIWTLAIGPRLRNERGGGQDEGTADQYTWFAMLTQMDYFCFGHVKNHSLCKIYTWFLGFYYSWMYSVYIWNITYITPDWYNPMLTFWSQWFDLAPSRSSHRYRCYVDLFNHRDPDIWDCYHLTHPRVE